MTYSNISATMGKHHLIGEEKFDQHAKKRVGVFFRCTRSFYKEKILCT